MPVSNLQTRATCGAFYFVFQNYMQRRVHKAVEARTFAVTLGWPLSVARTVVIGSVFVLALCHTAVNSPSACPARGDNAAKENFAYVLESKGLVVQPVERLLSTVRMLATATRFVSGRRTLQTQNRYIVTVRLGPFGFMVSVAVAVFIAGLLLACGDVEANPGPLETTVTGDNAVQQSVGTEEQTSQHSDQQEGQSLFARYHSEMTQALNQAVIRLESATRQAITEQGHIIDERLQSVEDKIEHRLQQVEEEQARLASDAEELHTQYQAVWRENQELRNAVGFLGSKCDYLENQSRRNNLLFLGFPAVPAGTEHWDECERKVKEAIREGMGITEDILIERAHRSGKAIVAKFLSYKQKTTVLTQARKLNQSETFKNIYVREDFSETVRMKRKELMSLQREMRQNGQPSKLRFDKLVTDRAIFTYDLDRQEVRREDNRRRHGGSGPSTKQDGGLVHAPASNNRGGAVTDVNTRRSTVDHMLSTAAFPPLRATQNQPPASLINRADATDSTRATRPQSQRTGSRIHTGTQKLVSNTAPRQQSSTYNLRARGGTMSTTADPGPSTGGTGEDRGNRSSSTATTGVARQPLTPASQTSRGFGRGRTGTPPAQTRIDSMFSSAQPSHVPVAEDIPSEHTALTGEETGEDRDEPFGDAADVWS